jgi:hypothetical protein
VQLAKLDKATQQRLLKQLREGGKLPRPLLPRPEGAKKLVALPEEPRALAQAVLERYGTKAARALQKALTEALEKAAGEPDQGPRPRKRGRPPKSR